MKEQSQLQYLVNITFDELDFSGQQSQQQNLFGNQSIDFNNAFNSNNTTTPSSNTNLMDDLLQPERQSNSSAGITTESARMTGDLDQGLQQMAQSLGFFCLKSKI